MAKIFAFREDRLGFRFDIGKKLVLGRAPDCGLILFDRSASRQHAEIALIDDEYYITDLASTNGTLLNERPITVQSKLGAFDTIRIGQELFIFDPKLDVLVGPAAPS
ncbi:MAG: FHA domain-containing protein, partial [Candidatus Adiutrix sp.]